MALSLASLAILVATGLLAMALSRWPKWATALGSAGAVAGCALGLVPALAALSGREWQARWPWTPAYGDLVGGIDRRCAFFLRPPFAVSAVAALSGPAH